MIKKIENLSINFELFLVVLLKIILDVGYYYIHKTYGRLYYPFDFDITNYILSWVFAISIYMILFYKRTINIFIVFLLLYILYVLPIIVYFSFNDSSLLYLFYLIIPYIIMLLSVNNLDFSKSINYSIKAKYIVISSILLSLIVLFHLIWVSNGEFVIDLRKVYAFREQYDASANMGFWAYLNPWVFKIFSLFILAWSLYNKKFLLSAFAIILMFLFFIFTGHKSIFLSLFILIFFFILLRFNWNRIVVLLLFILFFLCIIPLDYIFDDYMYSSVFIRRLLFVHAKLSFTYFEFFTNNEFVYWSNGILKSFFVYPYDKNFTLLIGDYLNMPGTNANTGFLATGYMHAGFLGVMIYTLVGTLILLVINNFVSNETKFIKISIVFLPIYIFFTTSDLLTTLLTHGLFIAMLLVVLLPKYYKIKK